MTPNVPNSLSQLPVAFTYYILAPRDNPLKQIGKLIFFQTQHLPQSNLLYNLEEFGGNRAEGPWYPSPSFAPSGPQLPPSPREY